ncbi:zinc finger CCHC domain-containing protein 9-like [Hydractinia symbiolongicarpus]|uniref:zinc finger CCHC domain-containing protein 9-like n=1 Tax=Hydractinia symbiolongicarpus TaxID=13093 RepID=UPI00254AFEC8|nr:zinc finger CCHC domain-containing protein 9-like [Hydractinia symbiolongicarpus]
MWNHVHMKLTKRRTVMTRWARGKSNTEHSASTWDELKRVKTNFKKKAISKGSDGDTHKHSDAIPPWLAKRREARRNRRKKMKPCFHCRQPGHQISDCPKRIEQEEAVGVCFKCGSSEHTVHECTAKVEKGEYPFAKCFICKETGHLSSKCPDNPRGLYPEGGGCKFCGSVEHYRKDCPERQINQKDAGGKKRKYKMRQENQSADAVDISDEDSSEEDVKQKVKTKKVVKF